MIPVLVPVIPVLVPVIPRWFMLIHSDRTLGPPPLYGILVPALPVFCPNRGFPVFPVLSFPAKGARTG